VQAQTHLRADRMLNANTVADFGKVHISGYFAYDRSARLTFRLVGNGSRSTRQAALWQECPRHN
jgi:hypothetical protein